ncbi:MAG: hypothetical protein ACRDFX_06185 [Chloroflexota bacterium]
MTFRNWRISSFAALVAIAIVPAAVSAATPGPARPTPGAEASQIFMRPSNVTQVRTYTVHSTNAGPSCGGTCAVRIQVTLGPVRTTPPPMIPTQHAGTKRVRQFRTDNCISYGCGYYYGAVEIKTCSTFLGGCGNWMNQANWEVKYNGNYVYLYDWVRCTPTSYYPYSQNISWCNVSNDGGQGSGYANFGDDWTVYGFGTSCSLFQRQPVDTYGNLLIPSGYGSGSAIDC